MVRDCERDGIGKDNGMGNGEIRVYSHIYN